MSTMGLALAPAHAPRGPRSITTRRRLLLLVGLLLTALVAAVLPTGTAATGDVSNASDTYYSENGKCYAKTVAATGVSVADSKTFIDAMTVLVGKIGHGANFTYNNGTVTATANVDCPPGEAPGAGMKVFSMWIMPALGVLAGLIAVVGSSLAITAGLKAIGVEVPRAPADSNLRSGIMSIGGLISTAILGIALGASWQGSLASGIAAIFTTYLVDKYGFGKVQGWLQSAIDKTFGVLPVVGAAVFNSLRGYFNQVEAAAEANLAQVRG